MVLGVWETYEHDTSKCLRLLQLMAASRQARWCMQRRENKAAVP